MNQTPTALFLGDALLERFSALIYERSGVRVPPQKKTLLSNRLRRRLRATGLPSFDAYYRRLTELPENHPEWAEFLQEVTTHETYLFRDEVHWTWLQRVYLPEVILAASRGERPRELRFWSAACSTGDEAYTIAACIASRLPQIDQWRVEILGTDLGAGAIARAQEGKFGARAMRLVPPEIRRRFFIEDRASQTWTAGPELRSMVTFRRHNLMTPIISRPFDMVFLKNVLIYFDAESKRRALKYVGGAVRPGGYLVTGAAEGVLDLLPGFVRLQSWLHRKGQTEQ